MPEPKTFYSYTDEKYFFDWLDSIEFIGSVKGGEYLTDADGRALSFLKAEVTGTIDDANIADLISLLMRYQLDMKCIKGLVTEENRKWLEDPKKYWYPLIF